MSNVQIIGPYSPSGVSELPGRRALFSCEPEVGLDGDDPDESEPCVAAILSRLARRAYRRPATDADVETLLAFYRDGQDEGGVDAGMRAAVERLLVDPEFLFRVEADPSDATPGTAYSLSDLELASRLSFFLWSSIPDDALLDAAVGGRLSTAAGLDEQVRRMLADPRANALVENFAGQWLQLRKLRNASPDTATYIAFDENLRDAMWQETALFLEHELRDDHPIISSLTADYTYVNDRLARHYGIPNVYGPHFRRVNYPDETRGGLLGHASILTITSYANRTSPVVRGGLAAREFSRHAAVASAARCAKLAGRRPQRGGAECARAVGATPVKRGVRELPQRHRPARFCVGAIRCDWSVADDGRRRDTL